MATKGRTDKSKWWRIEVTTITVYHVRAADEDVALSVFDQGDAEEVDSYTQNIDVMRVMRGRK